jgi:hypothetical protein
MKAFDIKKFLVENKLTNQSKLILEEFLFVNTDGDKVYKDEKGLYYFDDYKGEKLYYHPDYPPTRMSDKKLKNPGNLSWKDFQIKFPQVKDDNLAGEVYSIMQQQDAFDSMDYDDEDIISFMNAASTWTDAEDVADYFDEPASDLGKLIASYYQEKSGYEGFDDKWDNYLDHLFPQTEREGNDIDDWRIAENKHTIDRPYWFIDEMDLDDHLENMHNEWEKWKERTSPDPRDITTAKRDVIQYMINYLKRSLK